MTGSSEQITVSSKKREKGEKHDDPEYCRPFLLTAFLRTEAEAQQTKKIPRIGYLSLASQLGPREEVFIQGLRDLGWIDGQSISIDTAARQATLTAFSRWQNNWFV